MAWKLSNFADGTLAQAAAELDTTLWVTPALAALLPALSPGDKAKAVIFNSEYKEIVNITDIDPSGELTVEREQESTSARAWAAGTRIIHTPTAEVLQLVLSVTTATAFFGVATKAANIYSINVGVGNPVPSLIDGEEIAFIVDADNTAASSIQVTNGSDTTAVRNLRKNNNVSLRAGDIAAGYMAVARYSAVNSTWMLPSLAGPQAYQTELNEAPLDTLNFLSNGDFDAASGGTSFVTPASGAETLDNLYASYDGTIGVFTVNRQTFTIGQTDVLGNPKYFARWDQSNAGSGSSFRRLRMRHPDVAWRSGENVTISAYLKADAARNVTARIVQHFGTGGTPSAEVIAGSEVWALTTSWQRFDFTVALPSVALKSLGSAGNDAVIFELSLPVNTTMTIDIARGRLEPGQVLGKPGGGRPRSLKDGGTGISCETLAALAAFLLATSSMTDLAAIEALAGTSGFLNKTAANTWALRTMQDTTGLTWTNPAGVAGNPSLALSTGLVNYHNDPMSVAELASVTAPFGTAAFKNLGTSGDTVPKNDTANVFSAAQTISLTAAGAALTLASTDAGATGGPDLVLDRNSASPAVSDILGQLVFRGKDSGGNVTDYGYIHSLILDPTNGSEDGQLSLHALVAGADTQHLNLGGGQALFPNGAAASPAVSAISDTNTGFVFTGGDQIDIAAGGALKWRFGTSNAVVLSSTYQFLFADAGTAGAPSMSISGDTNSGFYPIGADNLGLSLGGTLRYDFSTSRMLYSGVDAVLGTTGIAPTSIYSLGYRGLPTLSGNSAYAFPLAEAEHCIYHNEAGTRTYTIPANASVTHPIGTVFVIDNTGNSGAAGAITLAITSDTLRRGDGVAGTGTRTISANQVAMIRKVTATEWVITGVFS